MTENLPSIVVSDSILESTDIKTKLKNTPMHKLNTSFVISAEELCNLNSCKERAIRHKSVCLSSKYIKKNLQKQRKIISNEECNQLIDSVLSRKKDVCPGIRSLVIQTIGYLILKKHVNYLHLLFEGLKDKNTSTVLTTLKSINELLVLHKNEEFKKELINNFNLILEINENETNKKIKEECTNLIFKMFKNNFIELNKIYHLIHLAPKEMFIDILDEILGQKNDNEGYSHLFNDYEVMIKLYKINNEIFSKIEYSEINLTNFIQQLLEQDDEYLGLKVLEKIILKDTPLIYFINLINKNIIKRENLEIILNILVAMEENEEKSNLEEKENLLNLLLKINMQTDILDYILKYLYKGKSLLFSHYVDKLTNEKNVNRVIKYFDVNYNGDIIYQCYKFLWLIMKEENTQINFYNKPLNNYEELIKFIIFLYSKIKEIDSSFHYTPKESSDVIDLFGSLKEKLEIFLNYLLNYLKKYLSKLNNEEIEGYCKLVEQKLIIPNLKMLFSIPLKDIQLKPQEIVDYLFEYLNYEVSINVLKELRHIKGPVDVFNHIKDIVSTDKEELIPYFIKFISTSEAIFLESKVKSEEVKTLLKNKIFKSKKVKELPKENIDNTTFI